MSEFTCPDCGGGFPASAADDDACPWCGEAMDGEPSDDARRTVARPSTTVPATPPTQPVRGRGTNTENTVGSQVPDPTTLPADGTPGETPDLVGGGGR